MFQKIALTAAGAAAGLLSACSSGTAILEGNTGNVRFVMSGATAPSTAANDGSGIFAAAATGGASLAPADGGSEPPRLQAANVTFTSIVARSVEGKLVEVTADFPFTVDVVQIARGREVTLPIGSLPPATYDQLVVVMSSVELVREDGTTIVITPPGGGWTSIVRVVEPFTVVDGQTTTVRLKMRWWTAFRWLDDHFEFEPEFECEPR